MVNWANRGCWANRYRCDVDWLFAWLVTLAAPSQMKFRTSRANHLVRALPSRRERRDQASLRQSPTEYASPSWYTRSPRSYGVPIADFLRPTIVTTVVAVILVGRKTLQQRCLDLDSAYLSLGEHNIHLLLPFI